MKVTTSRAFRRKYIKTYTVADFESFDDYFFYIHLNPSVRWAHAGGSLLGASLLPWGISRAVKKRDFLPLALASGIYYGVGFVSHYVSDGVFFETSKYDQNDPKAAASTPASAFLQTYKSLFKLICNALSGKSRQLEKEFISKYPHTLWVFDQTAPRPDLAAIDSALSASI